MNSYASRYGAGETLHLPYTIRTYFDNGGHESTYITPKQKLLDIGYVTTMGYDIYADILDILENHPYISEDEIKVSLALLLSELSGKSFHFVSSRYEPVSLREMTEDLKNQLLREYVLPNDGSEHYIVPINRRMTEEELRSCNHWNAVADSCCGNEALYSEDKEYIYPGDECILERYNATASEETRFILNTIPYPFQGNPLTAKIIILSLNPGYIPRVNHYFAKVLQHYPQLAEGVMCFMRENLRLNERDFLPENDSNWHPNYQDAYNMLADWYWYDILAKLSCEGLTEDEIFSNVALIQLVAYSSEKAKDLPVGCVLPSQIFAKKMITYIADNRDTIFIVPRAVKKWKTLLGSIWKKLEREERLIVGTHPLCQHLTSNNLGPEQYKKIIYHLKK